MLPKGITGFGEWNQSPVSIQDERLFCQLCYSIARENHGTVLMISCDTTGKNFYSAQIERYHAIFYILQNIHYPYVAFAASIDFNKIVFIDIPHGLHISDPNIHLLTPSELNQDWHDLVSNLSESEMEQIRYWKPQTVKEIIFNFWD